MAKKKCPSCGSALLEIETIYKCYDCGVLGNEAAMKLIQGRGRELGKDEVIAQMRQMIDDEELPQLDIAIKLLALGSRSPNDARWWHTMAQRALEEAR